MSENVLRECRNGVQALHIHRPDKKNALTGTMYDALGAGLRDADADPAVRVVLIHGQTDCFTAGNDLKDFLERADAETSPALDFLGVLTTTAKPVVAAVGGVAVGIGTTLLLHCDLVVAAHNARFQLPFASLGLCPEGASSLLLPRLAGWQAAAELLMLGEAFDATRAADMGLVNRVVAPEALLESAWMLASRLAAQPAGALRETKALMREALGGRVADTLAREGDRFRRRLHSPEAKEAFSAFLEKRRPDFSRLS